MQPRHTRSASTARRVATPPSSAVKRPAEKPVDFFLNLPGAKSAAVAGTFNGWDFHRNQLQQDATGGWKTTVWLPPGRYEYRFVIDGSQWCSDPRAMDSVPNDFGSTNSVVVV
jgi:1,4-alpha-glucan branching enzyme